MFKPSTHLLLACYLALSIGSLGCQSTSETAKEDDGHEHGHDHDHADVSMTFQDAVAELTAMRDQISNAIENDDPELAHNPLHEVSEILEAIPELAADTDLPESEWQQVKAETERLFDAFSKIDSAFHKQGSDKKAVYEEVKASINEGVANLEAMLTLLGDTPKLTDHKEGHHEGDNHDAEE